MGNRCFRPNQALNSDLDISEHGFPGAETRAVEEAQPRGNTSPSFFNFSLTAPGGVPGQGDDAFWDGESTRNCEENTRMFASLPPDSIENTPQSRGKSVSFLDKSDTEYGGAEEHDSASPQTPGRLVLSSSDTSTPYSIGKGAHRVSVPPAVKTNVHDGGGLLPRSDGANQGGGALVDSVFDQREATDTNEIECFDTSEVYTNIEGTVIPTRERAEGVEEERRDDLMEDVRSTNGKGTDALVGTGTGTCGQSSSIIETVRDNPDHVVKQPYALSTPEDLSFDVPSTETAVVESKVVPV